MNFNIGFYNVFLDGSPCSTFSVAREAEGGPPPLRGPKPPEIYGLPNPTPAQTKAVKCLVSVLRTVYTELQDKTKDIHIPSDENLCVKF